MTKRTSVLFRTALILVALALAALLTLYLFGRGLRETFNVLMPGSRTAGFSTSMEPVDLILEGPAGRVYLRIPKAYLSNSETWRGGLQPFVEVKMLLPDMTPRESPHDESIPMPGIPPERSKNFRRVVEIDIKWGNHFKLSDLYRKAFYLLAEEPTSSGLKPYKADVTDEHGERLVSHTPGLDNYLYASPDKVSAHRFRCGNPSPIFGRCSVTTEWQDLVRVEYSFDRQLLSDWHEIDAKIEEFVKSTIVKLEPVAAQ